ncbi:MAG: DUF4105 domain-containing protein [Treponema sp.]|jgi:hypothetical protein|nr:DUF4105 domain-containing protein [Treponema sp.]
MPRGMMLLCFLFVSLRVFPAEAGGDSPAAGRGDHLTLKIAVMGPGDQLYFWWGHIALVIDDETTGQSRFYDYGIFSFEKQNFFLNFALGRLIYSTGVSPAELNYRNYIWTNRDITVYTLDIPPAKREEVRIFAETNVLPENRDYFYHHFKDNCATRIRDIIDLAVDGQFRAAYGEAPGRFTLRQHVRRHTWFSPFMDWILNFWMGQDIDVPVTVWQEMFLPAEIGGRIDGFRYTDGAGTERSLVSSVEVLNRAVDRPAVLAAPPSPWSGGPAPGILLAVLSLALVLLRKKKPRPGRVLLGLYQAALGLFFGGAGLVLFFMAFFTDHDYTFHNANLLFVNPLLLAALPLGIRYAAGGDPKKQFFRDRMLKSLWTYVFLAGILTMIIKLFPGFYQQNQPTQALVLPFALVLGLAGRFSMVSGGK